MIYYPHGVNQIYIYGGQYVKQKDRNHPRSHCRTRQSTVCRRNSCRTESLQKKVEGLIQALYPFDDPVAIVCNVESDKM